MKLNSDLCKRPNNIQTIDNDKIKNAESLIKKPSCLIFSRPYLPNGRAYGTSCRLSVCRRL